MKNINGFNYLFVATLAITGCTPGFQALQSGQDPSNVGRLLLGKSATGTLAANPATCTLNEVTGLCSTTITWSSKDANIVQVTANGNLFAGAQSGSALAPWIGATPVTFELWGDGSLLASLSVVGLKKNSTPAPPAGPTGTLSANPTTCVVNPNTHVCSSTITWNATGAKDVKVYANGNLFLAAESGTNVAPWIGLNPVVFELRGDGILLASATVVGTSATPPVNPPTPVAQPIIMNPDDCQATDATSLNACAKGLVAKTYTGIAVMNDITCSGPRACDIHLDHFKGPARIYGYRPDGKNVTIYRKDHFDYSIIEIVTSSDIEIRNLDFREGEVNKPAGNYGTPGYDHNLAAPGWDHNLNGDSNQASPPISIIFQSKNIFIDHIGVYEAKLFGMIIGNCDYVTVRNSIFKHNWSNGIWVTNGLSDIVENDHAPIDIRIENNTFIDNRCVSIGLSAQGNSWVSGNYISHNHMGSLWHAAGGQFSMEATTTSLKVVDNEITNGVIDEDPVIASLGWKTVAVEFTDSHVHGVHLDHNYLHNNTGGGIIHDPLPGGVRSDFGPIKATDNVFNNPWMDFVNWDPGELIQSGNCSGPACTWKKSTGQISSSAQICNVDPVNRTCALTVTWSSAPARTADVKVMLNGVSVAAKEAGSQKVTLPQGLHRFDLYDGVTLLDSVYVGAK